MNYYKLISFPSGVKACRGKHFHCKEHCKEQKPADIEKYWQENFERNFVVKEWCGYVSVKNVSLSVNFLLD